MEKAELSSSISTEDSKIKEALAWTLEEDNCLRSIVEQYGTRDWTIITDNFNIKFPGYSKSSKQCRSRWQKHIQPSLLKQGWTEREEVELLAAHQTYKNSWSDISKALGSKKNNSIKNRFYTVFRKVKNKVKKSDFSYASKVELLQIHYILSVMETYLVNISSQESIAEKAGKDFAYKLVQHIDLKMLAEYKKKFTFETQSFGTMAQLFSELLKDNNSAKMPIPQTYPALIENKEEMKDEEEKKDLHLNPIPVKMEDSPDPIFQPRTESSGCGKDLFGVNYAHKDCSPLENMVLGEKSPDLAHKFEPSILSAGPAAAAEAAIKAPVFQASPDDIGFSEYTEGGEKIFVTSAWHTPNVVNGPYTTNLKSPTMPVRLQSNQTHENVHANIVNFGWQ